MRRRAGCVLAVMLLAAGPVFAAPRDEWTDENKDGRKETHLFYEGAQIVRAEVDVDGDGKIDRWIKYKDGKRFAAENDRNQDGRMDRWDFYTTDGVIGRTAKDTNADGKPDSFTTLVGSRETVMKEQDRNGDGKIDRRRFCRWMVIKRAGAPSVPGDKPVWTEEDNDFDGKIDRYIDKKNPAASKSKIGKPMDGHLTPFLGAPSEAAAPPGMPAEGAAPITAEGPRKTAVQRRVDIMNARHGYDAADWDPDEKGGHDEK